MIHLLCRGAVQLGKDYAGRGSCRGEMIRLLCVATAKLALFLIPLLSVACGTLEVGIERTPKPNGAAAATAVVLATENAPPHPLEMTPTPVPEDYVPPTPAPAFTPMPVDTYPAPAGLRVAFVRDSNIWLWTAEGPALSAVEGREAIPLTSAGDASGIVKISDDGAIVAFMRGEEGELWAVNAYPEQGRRSDGTSERQLLSAEDLEAMESDGFEVRLNSFEWVPGTHIIAFNTRLRLEARDVPADDLRLVNADTLEQSVLLPPGKGGQFYYSPDGSQIAIVTPGEISLVNADGGSWRDGVLTYTPVAMYSVSDYYAQPVWAADGSSLMVAIPPADPHAQPIQHTTVWYIPTDSTPASLVANIAALPVEGAVAFSHELNYVAYAEVPQSGIIPTERTQIWLKVMRLKNGDWASYPSYYGVLYGWAPNSRRFAFLADTGHQRPQLQIGQWSGGTIPGSVDAGTPVDNVRWVDADHYLFVAGRDWEKGAEGDSFDLVLGSVNGSSTILASTDSLPPYDFASESTLTLTPAKTPTVPSPTQEGAPHQTTPALTSNAPTLPPTNTPEPNETPANPQILSFEVTPPWIDPGDTVTLTWEAHGDRATICPSARFVLFTSDDCQQVPLSGVMTFTIPLEATGFHFIDLLLNVETHGSLSPNVVEQVSVALKCHTTWFFSDEPQAGVCPTEPIRSYAAAQRFERGTMIWIEQLGRYVVLDETLLQEQDVRKQVDYVHDPLEIIRDTSAEIKPPEGFYAPESGFGLVWRGDVSNSPGYREKLGWALAPEFGYGAIFQCDDALPSGGRSWQTCYLKGPDDEVIVFHPLGGWYLLGEREGN